MKSKGMIAFALVFAFILIYFSLVYSIQEFNSNKNLVEAQLIETENASFKRNLVENSVDELIKETIKKEIMFGSKEPKKIQEKTAENLIHFFEELEKKGIKIKEIELKKEYKKTKIKGKKTRKKFIQENSRIIVIKLYEKIYLTEFYFTAGKNKNKILGAEIKENSSKINFFVPAGYSIKTINARVIE